MPDEPLQFDRAEPLESGARPFSCSACAAPIAGTYWQANGHPLCPACRQRLGASLEQAQGSTLGRLSGAVLLGSLGGAAGSAVYFAILKLTGYELGLVAILVGFLVGGGVKKGSRAAGGRGYQLLAAGLTYFFICLAYLPRVFEGLRAAGAGPGGTGRLPDLVAAVAAIPIAMLAPILAGFDNFIGWIIIAIGMWQAWTINAGKRVVFEGPFQVAASNPPVTP